MLRSLLKGVDGGVFAERIWLQCGGRVWQAPGQIWNPAFDPIDAFDAMLRENVNPKLSGRQLGLVVSNRLSRAVAIPWQQDLHSLDELESYAHACFEQNAAPLDDSWALQIQPRRRGTLGFAYALPNELIENLREAASRHKLRLTSVMPVSAAAYLSIARSPKASRTAIVLVESGCATALGFDENGMCGFTADPLTSQDHLATIRVLKRLSLSAPLSHIKYWSADGAGADTIAKSFPECALTALPPRHWSEL